MANTRFGRIYWNPYRKKFDDMTVKELQQACRNKGVRVSGRKDEIKERLNPGREPYWFWWDEAMGGGDHVPFFVCPKCQQINSLEEFSISVGGVVNPSIICGKCQWHPWGTLGDYDGGETRTRGRRQFYAG